MTITAFTPAQPEDFAPAFSKAYTLALGTFETLHAPASAAQIIELTEYLRGHLVEPAPEVAGEAEPVQPEVEPWTPTTGDRVRIKTGATHTLGVPFDALPAGAIAYVTTARPDEDGDIKVDGNYIHVDSVEPAPEEAVPVPSPLKVGDRVRIKGDAQWSCGDLIPGFADGGESGTIVHLPAHDGRDAVVMLDNGAPKNGGHGEIRVALSGLELLVDEEPTPVAEPAKPRKPLVGERVIMTTDSCAGLFKKGQLGTVKDSTGHSPEIRVAVRWDDNPSAFADYPPFADLVAFEPLTERPAAGDKLVILDESDLRWEGVGQIITVTGVKDSMFDPVGIVEWEDDNGHREEHILGKYSQEASVPGSQSRRFGRVIG